MSEVLQQPSATRRPTAPYVPQAVEAVKQRLPVTTAPIPTYYDQPPLKPSFYGWKVSSYMFIGGLAGSAQLIATLADFTGGAEYRQVIRGGRYLALAGTAIGAPLLIIDLRTPQRFYNMLRIFRPTSPMSIGSYVLVGFGAFSGLLAGAEALKGAGAHSSSVEIGAKVMQLPAAFLGALMSTYTGVLLGATSTPLWAAAPRLLPAAFGASAISSAAAALSLANAGPAAAALDKLEAVSSAVEICLLWAFNREIRTRGVETRTGTLPVILLASAPLLRAALRLARPDDAAEALPPTPKRPSLLVPLAVLAGAFLLRHVILKAGNRSARQPRDYFRLASPQ